MISTELAQQTIDELVSVVRQGDLTNGLAGALKRLVIGVGVERGLIWQVVGDRLTVTQEYSTREDIPSMIGIGLDSQKSTFAVLNFLSQFPDLTAGGSIVLDDKDSDWQFFQIISEPLCSSLLVLLSARFFTGFLAFQSSDGEKRWSDAEIGTVEKVAALMSILLNDASAIERLTTDVTELKALSKILDTFLERAGSSAEIILRGLGVVANLMGFTRARLYVHRSSDLLALGSVCLSSTGPLFGEGSSDQTLKLDNVGDPIVQCFESGRGRIIEPESPESEQFENKPTMIMPLIDEAGQRLGVFVLSERLSDSLFTPQDRERLLWIGVQLSRCMSLAKLAPMLDIEGGPNADQNQR